MFNILPLIFIFAVANGEQSFLQKQLNSGKDDILNMWEKRSDKNDEINYLRNSLRWTMATNERLWNEHRNKNGRYIVQYSIDSDYDDKEIAMIGKAMEAISENTCIDYENRENVDEENKHGAWLSIGNQIMKGCRSFVGRIGSGAHTLDLESSIFSNCFTHKTIVHELFHSLGLIHEHNRPDRDHYVEINFGAMMDSCEKHNFYQWSDINVTNYGVEYDYWSAMHYGATACSKDEDGSNVLVTKHPEYQYIIGTALDASPGDYKKICSIYNCTRCMDKPFTTQAENHCPVPLLPRYSRECDGHTPADMDDYKEKCCIHRRRTTTSGVWLGDCACQNCRPAKNCKGSDARYFPSHFAANCCGRCGADWLRSYCRKQDDDAISRTWLAHLREVEMCPPDEDSTEVPVSVYSGQCDYCVDCEPRPNCVGSDAQNFPSYFQESCCGRCGPEYIAKWCKNLPADKLKEWKEVWDGNMKYVNGYCSERITPATTPAPITTPAPTGLPEGVSVFEERRNCDLCSPNRQDCVTSNETHFQVECCGHCGTDWMNRQCNSLALTSAIDLKSSLYLFIWRKMEKCSMHALTPVAYRHFDGLDLHVDYTAAFCKHCVPKLDCDRSFLKHLFARVHPHYYHHCCGFCGYQWLQKWCSGLDESDKIKYKKLCPQDE